MTASTKPRSAAAVRIRGTPLRCAAQAPNLSLRADEAQLILEMESCRAALAVAPIGTGARAFVLTVRLKPVP
jgi:hypothetical protein